jgi:hypothetical protein
MDRVRRFLMSGLLCLLLAGLVGCHSNSNGTTSTAVAALSAITVNPSSVNGGQSVKCTVTLTAPAPSGGAVVMLTSSSGSLTLPQIQTISGPVQQVTIPQGAMSVTFSVPTIQVGSNQTAQIVATYLVTEVVTTTLTIVSTKPLSVTGFTVDSATVTSGQTVTGTVTLNAPAYSPGQQVFVASSDTSAQPQNPVTVPTNTKSVTFSIFTSPLTAQRTVTVTVTLNTSVFSVQLTLLPTGTAITSFAVVPFTVAGGQSMTGTVTVSPPAPAGGASIALTAAFTNPATPASTPLPITLPSPPTVQVPAGATQVNFQIMSSKVIQTTDVTLTATLNSSAAAFTVELVTGINLGGITCQQTTVTSGNSDLCSVTLSIPAAAGGQTVQLSSSNSTALPVPASVVVPAGMSNLSFTLVAGAITTPTPVTLTASLPGTTTGSVSTIVTAVPASVLTLTSFSLNASVVQGGAGAAGIVTGSLSIVDAAPPNGLAINLMSSDPSVVFCTDPTCAMTTASGTVTVPQNATSANFSLSTTAVPSTVKVTITASVNSSMLTAMLSVVPAPQVMSLSLSSNTTVGGNSVLGTVTLTSIAPQQGTTVTLQSSNTSLAQLAPTVTVTQGNTSAVFAVTTLSVPSLQMVTITASIGASSQQAMLTITAPPPDLLELYFNPPTVTTGQQSIGTVTLTLAAPTGGVIVNLSSAATQVTVPPTVTVPAGVKSASFSAMAATGVTTSTPVQVTGTVTASATNTLTVIPAQTSAITEQIVLTGETDTTDFPIHPSSGAFQGTLASGDDTGFLTSIGVSTPAGGQATSSYTFSTYLGGMSSFGQVRDVFVDSSGNVFACGVTMDPALPTTANAAQAKYGGGKDAFIAEFNASGTLEYLSYLGGSGDETCDSITVDSSGGIYVSGSETDSTAMGATNLMGTSGAFQTANAGGSDFFVAKINPTGTSATTRLVWLTFVGGAGDDFANGRIALSSTGVVAVSGTSQSTAQAPAPNGFPIPATQGRPNLTGVGSFAVVIGISADGTQLLSTTLLFGRTNGANPGAPTTTTAAGGIAFDANSNIYVCGQTNASDLPVSTNAFQPALNGTQNSYVAVLNTSGILTRLTYLGGAKSTSTLQACKGIAVDSEANPVIVMPTDASDYPLVGPGPAGLSGPSDIAVTKLTADLSTVIFSRLVGGSGSESADATRLRLDSSENLYFSLATNSVDFPVTPNAVQGTFMGASGGNNTMVAVVKLSADGSTILYASYLGGTVSSTTTNSTTSVFYHHN